MLVGQHGVYCTSQRNPMVPAMDLRMIVQEPFGAAEASLEAKLDLFWSPEDLVPLPRAPLA